jgi:hypothetical protein
MGRNKIYTVNTKYDMDIVICVSLKDCLIVKKNIYHINRTIEYDNIYLIADKCNFGFFPKRFNQKYNITLIDEEQIIPHRDILETISNQHFTCEYRFGWYYQQFLKMGFALSQYAKDFYLIWDSDTIPLNKLSFMEKGKMVFTPKTEYHKAYFTTIKALMEYNKEVDYSFIAEHMIISVPIMLELIQKIEKSTIPGTTWYTKIINATPADEPNSFSEFETYGTFCHHNYPDTFFLRELRTFREAGRIYSRGISRHTLNKLSKMYDTISLESWSIPRKRLHKWHNNIEMKIINLFRKLHQ